MGWRLTGKPRVVRVTRSLATQFSGLPSIRHDRLLRDARLALYAEAVSAGQFRPVEWATCRCLADGQLYRINGNHTSTMYTGMAEIPETYAQIQEYEADTFEDMAALYATFDSPTQMRNTRDVNRAYAAAVPALVDLPAALINAAVTGIAYSLHQDGYMAHTPAARAARLFDHVEFVTWLAELLGPGTPAERIRPLQRGPVVAAMLDTWNKDRRAATRFWTAVRDETGELPGLPDRVLAKALSTLSIGAGRGIKASAKKTVTSREVYTKCRDAWNAWRKGSTSLKLQYRPTADLAVMI